MEVKIKIEGMHCNGCVRTLENEFNASGLVDDVSVSLEDSMAIVKVKNNVKIKELEKIVKNAGFVPVGVID